MVFIWYLYGIYMVFTSEEERKMIGLSYEHQTRKKPPDCSEGYCHIVQNCCFLQPQEFT